MFEREIKFIYDFNLNKVNQLGPYFTFEQLFASDIHPAILHYISAEIDYLVFEDRQKLLKNSVFDYSGEKISIYFNQISEEVKKTKRFALEYVSKLILHASSFTINYLARPKWTMTKFIFEEENHKSTNEIKQILNYIYYYRYTNKILVSYINTKKILSMNLQEFEELLNKADKLGIETYLPGILTNALKSMADFFNIGEIKKTKMPLSAIEMFLKEKELLKHLNKIKETFGNDESAKFNLDDYQKVLNSVILEKEVAMPEEKESEKFETENIEEEKEIIQEISQEEIKKENITEEPTQETVNETELDLKDETVEDTIESDKEIKITQPTKLRIRIDQDNRIEPIYEEPGKNDEDSTLKEKDEFATDEITENELMEEITDEEVDAQDQNKLEDAEENVTENLEEIEADETEEKINETDELEHLSFIIKHKDDDPVEKLNDTIEEEIISEVENEASVSKEKPSVEEDKPNHFAKKISRKAEEKLNAMTSRVDLAEILEHKEMTKIIEVVFDYDIEDFASLLDEISNCKNVEDAHFIINETLMNRRINRTSKEAETFRSIISEYFGRK